MALPGCIPKIICFIFGDADLLNTSHISSNILAPYPRKFRIPFPFCPRETLHSFHGHDGSLRSNLRWVKCDILAVWKHTNRPPGKIIWMAIELHSCVGCITVWYKRGTLFCLIGISIDLLPIWCDLYPILDLSSAEKSSIKNFNWFYWFTSWFGPSDM